MSEWRDVAGFTGYRVSDEGAVETRRNKHGGLREEWAPLKPDPCGHGRRVTLTNDAGKLRRVMVSHLVLKAFIGNPPPGKRLADHRDLNPSNNRLKNLRWCSRLENNRNKPFHGVSLNNKGRWCARIRIGNGKRIRLGGYDTEEEARAAYLAARARYHGDFACKQTRNR